MTALGIGTDSFNTQPPEGGWPRVIRGKEIKMVSTHSRPKAAGILFGMLLLLQSGFNTQPPEGGWSLS